MSGRPFFVTSVLGKRRAVASRWPNGFYTCPFCCYPTTGPCGNPACEGNPGRDPADAARAEEEARTEAENRAQAARRTAALAGYAQEAEAREEAWRWAQVEEARRRGACERCLFLPGWQRVRFVRHRGRCPKER